MQTTPRIAGFFVVAVSAALAQPAAFEVASVRVSQSQTKPSVEVSPASLIIDGSMQYVLGWAYDVKRYQITGPAWLATNRYHISAKTANPASVEQIRPMLQALLAERLKVAVHRETKELAVCALIVAKNGPKLKESQTEGEAVTINNPKMVGSGGLALRTSMAQLADHLDGNCTDPVVDATGLKGRYDFNFDISAYLPGMRPGDLPGILSEALQKQLGLNLVPRKIPIEMLTVDHAEKEPIEN